MPLYDCVLLFKPTVDRKSVVNLMSTLGRLIYAHKGVITDIKSFGNIFLAYTIKKHSERFDEGQMMQMTVMSYPNLHKDLQYLNKEHAVLRWILVKNRGDSWLPREENNEGPADQYDA
ncbi:hypothetical protein GOP47_0016531 [Adiantum capillus-veneris]|uniref:Ribosomal protein S6 n=1 Tax=Adiantum capillus-veneris TaxID=13818 RepID=A0A9D4ZD26_ADICA|nr:hypothetical protein GOP47_0016531 [Adiantum capillus-veneris]